MLAIVLLDLEVVFVVIARGRWSPDDDEAAAGARRGVEQWRAQLGQRQRQSRHRRRRRVHAVAGVENVISCVVYWPEPATAKIDPSQRWESNREGHDGPNGLNGHDGHNGRNGLKSFHNIFLLQQNVIFKFLSVV